jgi:transcriptional regulator with XRE-family HTH domain
MAMARQGRSASTDVSPLRQARLAIPATLEQVCEDLDRRSKDGSSGVTPSMLSGWERGAHVTSIKNRKLLAGYYRQPADKLFAHQDHRLTAPSEAPRLLVGHHDLHDAMPVGAQHRVGQFEQRVGSGGQTPVERVTERGDAPRVLCRL